VSTTQHLASPKNTVHFLRVTGLVEGVSFILLAFVAMPLKYLAGLPQAVTIVGWVHGILFMLFGLALLRTWVAERWPFGRVVVVFIAALVPFGPFLIDRRMRQWEARGERA
jgi:integral membrane protein